MKNKIIYVDFRKKRKTTFFYFTICRLYYFLSNSFFTLKYNFENKKNIDVPTKKRNFS